MPNSKYFDDEVQSLEEIVELMKEEGYYFTETVDQYGDKTHVLESPHKVI